jgi:hypothetical protein
MTWRIESEGLGVDYRLRDIALSGSEDWYWDSVVFGLLKTDDNSHGL